MTVANHRYQSAPVAVFLPPGDYEVVGTLPTGAQTKLVQVHTGQVTSVQLEPLARRPWYQSTRR